jgi:hypothetical protein
MSASGTHVLRSMASVSMPVIMGSSTTGFICNIELIIVVNSISCKPKSAGIYASRATVVGTSITPGMVGVLDDVRQ